MYSGWTRQPTVSTGPGTTDPGTVGVSTPDLCEDAGKFCEQRSECTNEGGDILFDFECPNPPFGVSCCSVEIIEETCSQKGGLICSSGESCDGASASSSDGSCCLGSCEVDEEENDCELFGGDCRSNCLTGEDEDGSISCDSGSGDVCCFEEEEGEEAGGGSLIIIIILLVILIILVALAIIYRKRVKIWVYKRRGRRVIPGAPAPPRTFAPRPVARPAPVRRAAPSGAEKQMQETLKKLREAG